MMVKVKPERTADCVVGGIRVAAGGEEVASLVLGLYDAHATLRHVGVASSFTRSQRRELSQDWIPLRPDAVCEVAYDQLDVDRFRHPARFRRWRPDRSPRSCTFDQFESESPRELMSA